MTQQATSDSSEYQKFRSHLESIQFLKKSLVALDCLTERFGELHTSLAEEVLLLAHSMGWDTQEIFAQYIFDYLKEQMAFEQTGDSKLAPVREILGSDFSYPELKLTRLFL